MTLPTDVFRLLLLLPQRDERWPDRDQWLEAFTDVVRASYETDEETDVATLNVRPIEDAAAARIKRAAAARGLTIGQYLAKLSQLHEALLTADEPNEALEETGLGPVNV